MQEFEFLSPKSVDEACVMLADGGGRPAAGCTDILPQLRRHRLDVRRLVDLSQIQSLNYIHPTNGSIHLGPMVSYAEMLNSPVLHFSAPALVQAASQVGCQQTRNRGTLGGNLGNASPAGDTLPPLLVMECELVLTNTSGERKMALDEFLLGPGKTALLPGEIISKVIIQSLPPGRRASFRKLGNRQGMAVSVVSLALVIQKDEQGIIGDFRLALGAVAPTAIRCHATESFLRGKKLDPATASEAGRLAARECEPIDDIRAAAAYRRHAVQVLVKRAILSAYDTGSS